MIEFNYTFEDSITNQSKDPIDAYSPVTFLEWYGRKNFANFDINVLFENYRQYIIEWGKTKRIDKQSETNLIRDSYIQVLRDIVVNFSTEEEKRFVLNADFSDSNDLDIILPFFLRKLKSVCLYYVEEREELKTAAIQHNLRGSNLGIDNLIKKVIFDAAKTSHVDLTPTTFRFPPVSALAAEVHISVEELYDTYDQYYNVNPLSANTGLPDTLRGQLSSTNINSVDSQIYLNFKSAIVDAIKQYPMFIESLGTNNFTINPVLSGTELYFLKNRDFINYLSGGPDELRISLLKKLAPKYLGSDFYYLSTGSTASSYVSGILFSVLPLSGAATLNLLNRQYPSVAAVPSLDSLYTEFEIGRFFVPQKLGVLVFNTPDKTPYINTQALEPNKIYAFPDLSVVGNVSYNSLTDNALAPVVYQVDVTWNKVNRSNQFSFGDVLSDSYKQLYYGYQSQQQDLQTDVSGICKITDNIQFWGGDKQNIWTDSDTWPDTSLQDALGYTARQESLLVGELTPVYWSSDKHGNEYGLFKKIVPLQQDFSTTANQGLITGSATTRLSSNYFVPASIYERKNTIPGHLYFRNIITNTITPASASLSAVYLKYPQNIRQELENDTYYFALYYDTFVLETENYVVVDTVLFDNTTGRVKPTNFIGEYYKKSNLNNNIEIFVNEWLVSHENSLYLCFLNLLPTVSASNYKAIYPKIYKINLSNLKSTLVYPGPGVDVLGVYSLSAGFIEPPQINLFDIHGASFSYFDRNHIFNLTYLGKNLNSIPFVYNEQFVETFPYLKSLTPVLFKPQYFVYDNNYANPTLPFLVKYSGSSTGVMGTHDPKSYIFDSGQENLAKTVYYYHDGVSPVQINTTGNFIIQFDWESYDQTNLFIGCSGYTVKNVENNIVWNFNSNNVQILDTYGQVITAAVFETDTGASIYNTIALAKRVTYPDPSILLLTITSNSSAFSGLFCEASDSIYKNLHVTTSGAGSGIVFTDPFCINCGTLCTENFAVGTTLTLIGSANYLSKFTGWLGGDCNGSTLADCIFNITSSQSVTALFERLPLYRLLVYTPAGYVISTDGNIDSLSGKNVFYYLYNDIVSLSSLAPISGYEYRGYKGGPCDDESTSICTFYMTDNYNISAIYIRYYNYNLSIDVQPNGSYGSVVSNQLYSFPNNVPVTINCPGTCSTILTGTPNSIYGSTLVTLTANKNPGYNFVKWIGNPVDNLTNNACSFTMGTDYGITALFELGNFTFNVMFSGDGLGTAFSGGLPSNFSYTSPTSGVIASFDILNGSTFTLFVSALSGSTLLGLFEDIYCAGPGVSSCDISMNNNITVIAYITAGEFFTLNIIKTGTACGGVTSLDGGISCGTICTKTYPRFATVNLGASASGGCQFTQMYGEGVFYTYGAGPGILINIYTSMSTLVSGSVVDIPYGDYFGLETTSGIILTPPASPSPYNQGTGISMTNFDNNISVIMSQNRTVSAEFN